MYESQSISGVFRSAVFIAMVHTPICSVGAMAEHQHKDSEWMVSYRFMTMSMEDNRDGTDRLNNSEVLVSGSGNYLIAPTKMTMNMHMLGLMYAPSDAFAFMAMIPYIDNDMDHVTAMGTQFSTESSDLGDISLSVISTNNRGFIWNLGISFPTGSQDEEDTTPVGRAVLPYPMQIGSGTYDLIAGVGYIVERDKGSAGVQIRGLFRIGENDDGYRVGNQYILTGWYSHRLSHHLSLSVHGLYEFKGNYSGKDLRYDMSQRLRVVPTVDENLRGGQRFDLVLGINWLLTQEQRLTFEYKRPVWQNLDGPQLQTDRTLTLGWQKIF